MTSIPAPFSTFDLTGRTAVITGGSRGLGRETTLAFARAGADVLISSRRVESCEALAREVRETTGRRAVVHAAHAGKWDEIDGLAAAAYEAFDRVDVLVNNAGMSPFYETPSTVTEELWRKVVDVNLTGPFRLSALIGERMVADGGGSIINVSSAAANAPHGGVIPYAAAKAGLNAMTQAYARAFGPTVRVNAVLPGAFLTDISKAWDMEEFERHAAGFALRRGGEAHEIVGTMLYLASDASSYTTGALLAVDGGYVLPGDAG
ncbi:SDR family oxidoreductase [Conexibacter sp. W3-3-2]|uniref:SDR family NAD(P)-dependent oxidoreductase n=1 Tax=Conexibacter sp. W3-3-2 TaxID=2675227 RepID=UPI001325B8CF|nr:SDR family NAD(P)-dependent oxidoreductase [Conexibacter sp. W3-3-2]MTD46396.1 SDR family oxidoreductase [Conexibacter sp. W3-3-2]